jgi:branched-chain amino acid transport system substrate-binding protein
MVPSGVVGRSIGGRGGFAGARSKAVAIGALLLLMACRDRSPPPRITYPYPWLGPAVSRVIRSALRAQGSALPVEIPDLLMGSAVQRPGYDGEIDYALAMAAVPGIVAAVGPLSSRATLLVAPIYGERGIPLIAATATSRRLRNAGRWVFQLAPDDEEEGAFMTRFILDRVGARRVTIFYLVADEYGIGLRDGLVEALASRGVTPVDEVGIFEESPFDRRVGESLARVTPDVVVIAARTPAALAIARSVHERAPQARLLVGDAVLMDESFLKAAGAAGPSIAGVTWWHPDVTDTASRAFVRRFEAIVRSRPTAVDAMMYDAIMVAAQAARDAGRHPRAVRHYLEQLGSGRPPYRGVTGPISFGRDRSVNLIMVHDSAGIVVVGDGR